MANFPRISTRNYRKNDKLTSIWEVSNPNIPKCASGKVLFSNDQYCHKFDKKRSWQDLTIMLTFWFSVTSPKRPSPGTGKWQITTACPDSHVLSMERPNSRMCAHLLTLTGLLQLHIDHIVGCSFWLFPSFVPKDWTHSPPYLFNRQGSVTMRHRKLSESSWLLCNSLL